MSKSKATAAKSKVKEVEVELPSFFAGPRCNLPVWDDAQIEQENWGASLENVVTDERDRMKSVYGSEIVPCRVASEHSGGKRKPADNMSKEDEEKFVDHDGRALLETYMAAYYCANNKTQWEHQPQQQQEEEKEKLTKRDEKSSDSAGVATTFTTTDNTNKMNDKHDKPVNNTYTPLPVRWSRFSEIVKPFRPVIHYNNTPFIDPYASKTELRPLCQLSAMEKAAKDVEITQTEKSVDVPNDKTKSRSTSSKHIANEQIKRIKVQKNVAATAENNKRGKSSAESPSDKVAATHVSSGLAKKAKNDTSSPVPSTVTSSSASHPSILTHNASLPDTTTTTGGEVTENTDAMQTKTIEDEIYEEYSKSNAAPFPEIVTPVGNDIFTAADRMAHLHYWNSLTPSEVLEEYRRVEEFMSPYDETNLPLDRASMEKTGTTDARNEKTLINNQSRYSTTLRYKVQQAEALSAMSVAPPFVMRAFNSMLHSISILSKQMNNTEFQSLEEEQQQQQHEKKEKELEQTSTKPEQQQQQDKDTNKEEQESPQEVSRTPLSHHRSIDKGNYLWELIYPHAPGTCHPVYNPHGKYAVKLFIDGAFRKVVVDDVMPVDELGRPLLTITARKEFWPALLAKAILKALSLKCPRTSNTIMPNNMSVGKNDNIAHTLSSSSSSSSSPAGVVATSNEICINSAGTSFDASELAMLESLRLFYDSPEQLGLYLVGNLIPSYITAVHGRVEFVRYLMQWELQKRQIDHEHYNICINKESIEGEESNTASIPADNSDDKIDCNDYGTNERLVLCALRSVNEVTSHCTSRQLYTIDQVALYANTLAVHLTTCPSAHFPLSAIDSSKLTTFQTTNNINNTKILIGGKNAMTLSERQRSSHYNNVLYSSEQPNSLLVCAPPLLHSSRVITKPCLLNETCEYEEEKQEELKKQNKGDTTQIKRTDYMSNDKTNNRKVALTCQVKSEGWLTVEELMEFMEELIVWRFVDNKLQNMQASQKCDREEQMVSIEYNTITNSTLPLSLPSSLMPTENNQLAHNANGSGKMPTQGGGASAKHRTQSTTNTMSNKGGNINVNNSMNSKNNAMSNISADNIQVTEREVWWRVECSELTTPITVIGFFASPSIYEKVTSDTHSANELGKWENKQQTYSISTTVNSNKSTRDSVRETKRNRKVTLTTRAESEESCGLPTIVEVSNLSMVSNTNKDTDHANTVTTYTEINDINNTKATTPPSSTLPDYLVQPTLQHVSFQLYNAMRSEPLSDAFTLLFPQNKLSCHAIHLQQQECGSYLYRVRIPHMHVNDKLTFRAQGTMQLFEQLQDAERASDIYTIVDADYYEPITFPNKPVVWFKRVLSVSETTELTALLSILSAEADPQIHRILPQMHNLTQNKSGKATLSNAANKLSTTVSTVSPNVSVSHSIGGYSALSLSNASIEATATSANRNTNTIITKANSNTYSSSTQQYIENKDHVISSKQIESCPLPILHRISLLLIDLDNNKIVASGMMGQLVNVRLFTNLHGYMLMAYIGASDSLHNESLASPVKMTETDNNINQSVSCMKDMNVIDNINANNNYEVQTKREKEEANVSNNVRYPQRVSENDKTEVNVAGTTNTTEPNASRAVYDKGVWKLVLRTTHELKSFEPVAHALSVNQHKGKVERGVIRSCNSFSESSDDVNEKRCIIFKQQCVINEPTHLSVHVELLNKLNIPFRVRVVQLCDRLLIQNRHGSNSNNKSSNNISNANVLGSNGPNASSSATLNTNKHASSILNNKSHRDSNANSVTSSQNKPSTSLMKANDEVEVVLYNSNELFDECFVPNIFLTTEAIVPSGVNCKHTDNSNNNSNTTTNYNNEMEGKGKSMVYVVECSVKETSLIAWQEQCQCEQNNKFIKFFRKTVRDNKEKYKTEMELAQNNPEEFIAMKSAEHEKMTLVRQRQELELQRQQQQEQGGVFTSNNAMSSGLDANAEKAARSNAVNSTSKQRRSMERKKLMSASNSTLNAHDQIHANSRNSSINDDGYDDNDNNEKSKAVHHDEGDIAWLDELEKDLTIRYAWMLMFSSHKIDVTSVPQDKDAVQEIASQLHPVLTAMREYTNNVLTSHESVTSFVSSETNDLHSHLTNRINGVDGTSSGTAVNNNGVSASALTRSTSLSNKSGPNAGKNKQSKESTNVLLSSTLSSPAAIVTPNTNTPFDCTSFSSYLASFSELQKFIGQDAFMKMGGNDGNVNSVNELSNNVQNTVLHAYQARACREEFLRNPFVIEFPQVSSYLSNGDSGNVSASNTITNTTSIGANSSDAVHTSANNKHNNVNNGASSNHHRSHHRSLSSQSQTQSLTSSLSTSQQSTPLPHHRSNKTSVVPVAEKPHIIMPYQAYRSKNTTTRESDGVSDIATEDDIRIIRHCWFATPLSPSEQSVKLTPLYAYSEKQEQEEQEEEERTATILQNNKSEAANTNTNTRTHNNNQNNTSNTNTNVNSSNVHDVKSITRVNARASNAANTSATAITNSTPVVNNVNDKKQNNNYEAYVAPSTTPMSSYNLCQEEFGNTASLSASLLSYVAQAQTWNNKNTSSNVEHKSALDSLRTAVQSYWQNTIEMEDKSDGTSNDKLNGDQKVTEKTLKSILASNSNGYNSNKTDDLYGASNANRHRRSVNNNNNNNNNNIKTEASQKTYYLNSK